MTAFTAARSALAVLAATVVLATGLTPPAQAQNIDPLAPPIAWEDCPPTVTDATAECGRIDVPMEYSEPEGATISVGFVRVPASDPSAKRGTLFGNPGGPGGDAYSYFGNPNAYAWPEGITSEWDRVAVQPRGLPGSTPLSCTTPGPNAEIDYHLQPGAFFQKACEQATPGYTSAVTTSNTAEDWEMVRRSLGLEQISIMGLSYGTYLGSLYATRYPQHTDRVVLDSAMDPSAAWNELIAEQEHGFDAAFHEFLGWVAARNDVYGLGDTPLQVYQSWSAGVSEEVGTNPTTTPPPAQIGDIPPGLLPEGSKWAGSTITDLITATGEARVEIEGLISRSENPGAVQAASPLLNTTFGVLPRPDQWPLLAELTNGTLDPAPATEPLTEEQIQQIQQAQITSFNAAAMQLMVVCNENSVPPNPAYLPSYLWNGYVSMNAMKTSQHGFAAGVQCQGITPSSTIFPLDGSQLETQPLQISGLRDPQTPYSGHRTIADSMGAHVVTVHGPGHGHVGLGNQAVDDIVVDYLRTGTTDAVDAPGLI